MVDDLPPLLGTVLPQHEKHQPVRFPVCRHPGQFEDALQHFVAVAFALLGVHIQHLVFPFGQVGLVMQDVFA